MDFETAARNALKAGFPQLALKACCFHNVPSPNTVFESQGILRLLF
jgi:hypothetical protein